MTYKWFDVGVVLR